VLSAKTYRLRNVFDGHSHSRPYKAIFLDNTAKTEKIGEKAFQTILTLAGE
jgi:hypothetical protein